VRLFCFLTGEIHQKYNLQNQEIKNKVIFHMFQLPEVRNKIIIIIIIIIARFLRLVFIA
jgi:hypothetical protein